MQVFDLFLDSFLSKIFPTSSYVLFSQHLPKSPSRFLEDGVFPGLYKGLYEVLSKLPMLAQYHETMRFITILFILLSVSPAIGQKNLIGKVWVGENMECLRLYPEYAKFMFLKNNDLDVSRIDGCNADTKNYLLVDDTLRLFDEYYSSSEGIVGPILRFYTFKLLSTKDTLILKPIGDNAFNLAAKRNEVRFWPLEKALPEKFEFDSLVFSSTMCFGDCPEMTYSVKGRNVLFEGGHHAVKEGKFSAKLTKRLHRRLKKEVRNSALYDCQRYCSLFTTCSSTYSLSIHNGTSSYRFSDTEWPAFADDLLKFLLYLPNKIEKDLNPAE